jgi:hypothetical protein
MPTDVRELLERGAPLPLRDVDVDALSARGRQWRRRRTAVTAAAVAAVVSLAVLPLPGLLSPPTRVAFDPPTNDSLTGTWVSTDTDGSSQTMKIRAEGAEAYGVVLNDDAATVCSGAPATLTGTGQIEGAELVLPAPVLTCDDGTTPVPVDGSSLEEAVRDYTLVYDSESATLTDNFGIRWQRPLATPVAERTEPIATGPLWPQSNMKEVREAQERADAGDPDYTWQVDRVLDDGRGPFDAQIFNRFLTEKLGWDQFRCCKQGFNETLLWSRYETGVVEQEFVRCGDGSSNTMYPEDPDDGGCAPTSGDSGYERVRLAAYQPVDGGPTGIWVIQSSVQQPNFHQVKPLSDEEIARSIEPYLEARLAGKRADGYGPARIPLLYASSDGARYERFDYEVVAGPDWPFGIVHLKVRLFAGETVVEQPFKIELDSSSVVTPAPPFRLTMLDYDSGDRATTENGVLVPDPHDIFGSRVNFSADPTTWNDTYFGPHGPDTLTLVLNQEDTHVLAVLGDPLTPTGTCDVGNRPASADVLISNLRSIPNLSVSPPRPTRVGSMDAVQLDVTAGDQGEGCVVAPDASEQPFIGPGVLAPRPDHNHPEQRLWWGVGRNYRARLYVFDVADTTRTLTILVMAPKADFEAVLAAAQPVIHSFTLQEK